ncbi:hypothetical protein NXV13_10210 [Bacteroides ovatus]|nr:hypothetical protein [Bacteroides ovatus]
MKTRTFQEIYDFCRTDDTYRSYFEASDESRITGARARKYYYGDIRRASAAWGHSSTASRCGSLKGSSRAQGRTTTSMLTRLLPGSEPQGRYVPLPDRLYRGTCQEAGCAD